VRKPVRDFTDYLTWVVETLLKHGFEREFIVEVVRNEVREAEKNGG